MFNFKDISCIEAADVLMKHDVLHYTCSYEALYVLRGFHGALCSVFSLFDILE